VKYIFIRKQKVVLCPKLAKRREKATASALNNLNKTKNCSIIYFLASRVPPNDQWISQNKNDVVPFEQLLGIKLLLECLNTNFSILSPIKLQPLKIKLLVGKLRTQNKQTNKRSNRQVGYFKKQI
jgi:hypothetical protein